MLKRCLAAVIAAALLAVFSGCSSDSSSSSSSSGGGGGVTQSYWYCWDDGHGGPHHLGYHVSADHVCTDEELRTFGCSYNGGFDGNTTLPPSRTGYWSCR